MRKKKIFRIISIVLLVYALAGLAFFYGQERIIFNPLPVPADSSYHFNEPYREAWVDLDKNTRINLVQFTVPDSLRKGIVLYFHGNKGNVRRYRRFAVNFTKHGYEVWMPDYPGFGKSTGTITEPALYEMALQVYKLARQQYQPSQIIIYGKSLGTGMATQLAAVRDCRQLILETPYYSMRSLIGMYLWMYPLDNLLHYQFRSDLYIPKVTAPITIFHGTSDWIIPYRNASRLKSLLKQTDRFITIPGGEHRNLNGFPKMQQELDRLLAR
jgi:alpha-beta hydrolase superfamily lysophospholipase